LPAGDSPILSTALPGINVNLLGMMLQTDPVALGASAQAGGGNLLGNVFTTLNNSLGATPDKLNALHGNVNAILAKVMGLLNGASLIVPPGALAALSGTLQSLALPNLLNAPPGSTAGILNLSGGSSPVGVNLLGLKVASNALNARLSAQTGDGQVLGNMLYNLANITNPTAPAAMLSFVSRLGFGRRRERARRPKRRRRS
jgi:hypothetical protein